MTMDTVTSAAARPRVPAPRGVNPARARATVRALMQVDPLPVRALTAPLLVLPEGMESGMLPGAEPLSAVPATVRRWADLGIRGVKIFAYGDRRDPRASAAVEPGNRMLRAIAAVRAAAPDMVVTTEVCGCSWTDHGECALLTADGRVDREATNALMAAMAIAHAEQGADVVSPTAMLDGSVRAVRDALTAAGWPDVGVCPNLAVHTSLYGPFKELMGTNPGRGDRRGFQLEPGRADRDILTQADRWLAEGADALTVQPVLTCMDLLVRLREHVRVPLIAYSTSGEYPALVALGAEGRVEYHAALLRAGADLVLTYAAEHVAQTLRGPA
jgi:porphobilinogen synthase